MLATTAATTAVAEIVEQTSVAQQAAGGPVALNWLGNEVPQLPVA